MAVSGLEQRYVPLLEWQFVWQPWGPAGRYPLDGEHDEAAKSQRIYPGSLQRSHSWGGYATDAQRERFQLETQQPSQGCVSDLLADELDVAECADVSCRQDADSSSGEGHSLSPYRSIDMEAMVLKDEEQVFQGSSKLTCGASVDHGEADPAVSSGGLDTLKSPRPSDLSTGPPSENSCESSCDSRDFDHSIADEPSSPKDSSHDEPGRHARGAGKSKPSSEAEPQEVTTLMLQNLPYALSRDELLGELERCGYAGLFDFCHVPHTFTTGRNQGVAFVNFISPEIAESFAMQWHGSRAWPGLALIGKALRVKVATVQGIEACKRIAQSRRMKRVKTGTFKPLIISGQVPHPH